MKYIATTSINLILAALCIPLFFSCGTEVGNGAKTDIEKDTEASKDTQSDEQSYPDIGSTEETSGSETTPKFDPEIFIIHCASPFNKFYNNESIKLSYMKDVIELNQGSNKFIYTYNEDDFAFIHIENDSFVAQDASNEIISTDNFTCSTIIESNLSTHNEVNGSFIQYESTITSNSKQSTKIGWIVEKDNSGKIYLRSIFYFEGSLKKEFK